MKKLQSYNKPDRSENHGRRAAAFHELGSPGRKRAIQISAIREDPEMEPCTPPSPDVLGGRSPDLDCGSIVSFPLSTVGAANATDDVCTEDKRAVENAWLNIHELQEMFGNEGSSFYLRLGTMRKFSNL